MKLNLKKVWWKNYSNLTWTFLQTQFNIFSVQNPSQMNINYLEQWLWVRQREGKEQKLYIKMYCTEKALKLLLYRLLLPFTYLLARSKLVNQSEATAKEEAQAHKSTFLKLIQDGEKLCAVMKKKKYQRMLMSTTPVMMLVWKICRQVKSWERKERKKTSAIYLSTLSDRRHFIVLSGNKHSLLSSFHVFKLPPFSLSFYELS